MIFIVYLVEKILDEQIDESQIPKNEEDKKFIIVYDTEKTKAKEDIIYKIK